MTSHRFMMTRDGVRIAYTEHGSGPPLVYVRGWLSHLDLLWERPGYRSFVETLAKRFRVVRYDMRGNGLSDRDNVKLSLRTLVHELEDLVDHLRLEKFTLWGASFGGPIAIGYAANHPDRVERLVLDGTYAHGTDIARWAQRHLITLALRFFPEMGFLLLSNATHPNPHRSARRTLELGSQMAEPAIAARLYRLGFRTDVRSLLGQIESPTLVLHPLRSRSIPARLGQDLAARIPRAEFVGLEIEHQNSWEGDVDALVRTVAPFLGIDYLETLEGWPFKDSAEPTQLPDRPFVFVCYAHSDKPTVQRIVNHLNAQGFSVWMDAGITPGALWRDKVARAVESCGAFLLLASQTSLTSPHCVRETNFAIDENKPILVAYLEDVEVPSALRMSLSERHWIRIWEEDEATTQSRLVLGLKELMGQARASARQ